MQDQLPEEISVYVGECFVCKVGDNGGVGVD